MNGFAMTKHTNCCTSAAANTSARISLVMDTAVLVVSILVVLGSLLIQVSMT